MEHLSAKGCVLVDTTCGSVLNVWKMVHRCARDGFTVVIHGKHYHEETRATASQALTHDGGHYLCVRDVAEAEMVCAFIRGDIGGGRPDVRASPRRRARASIPTRDLQRIGLANQTTMLMTESLEIQEMLRAAMRDRYGEAELDAPLPRVRHDLFRHAGSPGRRARDARRRRPRRDGRDRRLQQQQHAGAGADVRAARADVPHRQRRRASRPTRIRHRPLGGGRGGERRALAARRAACRSASPPARRRPTASSASRRADPGAPRLHGRRSDGHASKSRSTRQPAHDWTTADGSHD